MSIDDFFWDVDTGSSTNIPVSNIEFAREPHVPVVLLVDRSQSMTNNDNIGQLNQGIEIFKESVLRDDLASKRVDLCMVSFNDTSKIEHSFSSVHHFAPPRLEAAGRTAMGDAISLGMLTLRDRLKHYQKEGIDCYRPWLVLMTDGYPTDMVLGDAKWQKIRSMIEEGERRRRFMFFSIGMAPEAIPALRELGAARAPLLLRENKFNEMFAWLSASFSSISQSQPGVAVTGITNPIDKEHGWGDIFT
jgi:uncharacterized protein YegL